MPNCVARFGDTGMSPEDPPCGEDWELTPNGEMTSSCGNETLQIKCTYKIDDQEDKIIEEELKPDANGHFEKTFKIPIPIGAGGETISAWFEIHCEECAYDSGNQGYVQGTAEEL